MFQDMAISGGSSGKRASGLTISQTAAMTLLVDVGWVYLDSTGLTYNFTSQQSHTFSSDSTRITQCFMGLIYNGTVTDLWVDAFVNDGKTGRGKLPAGYNLVHDLAWFNIAIGETDLSNSTTIIYRRIVV